MVANSKRTMHEQPRGASDGVVALAWSAGVSRLLRCGPLPTSFVLQHLSKSDAQPSNNHTRPSSEKAAVCSDQMLRD
jgi:hypothetical protein